MKKLLLSLFCLSSAMVMAHGEEAFEDANFYTGGKSAVIMTHFGTTHKDTRAKTIDTINQKAIKAFDGKADVFEAYTSRIVTKRVEANEGIKKYNPSEVLTSLKKQGYKNVIIQPTNIIDGVEMESIKREALLHSKDFNNLRVGDALLTDPHHYEDTIKAIMKIAAPMGKREGVVLVGHGTYNSATSAYAMFDYMAKDMNEPIYVGTVEGYPTLENVVRQLKKDGKKEITLMPMMFVAGDHAKNDIAGDWKESLEKEGFKVKVKLTPLGEIPEIQDMFVGNAKFLEKHRSIDIIEKKAGYAKNK
ncbi:MAG: sirohydrochlorin cobaltochelatase [Cetobacterium sp.]|uniref:sirohydrochlorin cobaltochelatase n=1 Tax=Cetobacterium sp. TaxID=2071632 RepID=UPI0025E15C17|nr:sirohydrochlorin cobaltochelatase [uncultured Cetobacterium sp.]